MPLLWISAVDWRFLRIGSNVAMTSELTLFPGAAVRVARHWGIIIQDDRHFSAGRRALAFAGEYFIEAEVSDYQQGNQRNAERIRVPIGI